MSRAPSETQRRRKNTNGHKARSIKVVLLYLPVHLLVAALTWRDIGRRSAHQLRGSKRMWRLLSALNMLGAVGYRLAGRRAT